MRIQEAAQIILEEFGKPLSSREIAKIALERNMASSRSEDPIFSLATSIEKNIRDGVYNKPRLVFLRGPKGRLIGLPSWGDETPPSSESHPKITNYTEIKAQIPSDLFEKLQLASQAKLANNFDELIADLLMKGLSVAAPDIKKELLHQLSQFD